MGEQTPADVIDAIKPASTWGVSADEVLAALRDAGFEVRPVVDADTRAEAERLRDYLDEIVADSPLNSDDRDEVAKASELLSRFVLGEEPR